MVTAVTPGPWTPPERAAPYLPAIYAAEDANGIPRNLLARLIYQESRYRPEIIDGTIVSRAGAVGIAQIVPRWHPNVNPRDPWESIDYAAKYLRQLFKRFGSWRLALAAYNWGQGNQQKDLADGIVGNDWPSETRNYVTEITADVPLA